MLESLELRTERDQVYQRLSFAKQTRCRQLSVRMEERTSSFVAWNATQKSKEMTRSSANSHVSCNQHSASMSQSHARSRVLSHSLKPYTDKDANASILQANAPPNYTGGFNGKFVVHCLYLHGVVLTLLVCCRNYETNQGQELLYAAISAHPATN